ncbi:uncharacterized protein UHOD_11643 [Ustilago sp. UG-2017b]|nr:uncharacterized protein UHOD_11643 [Ustilago sp. UG-2017b]
MYDQRWTRGVNSSECEGEPQERNKSVLIVLLSEEVFVESEDVLVLITGDRRESKYDVTAGLDRNIYTQLTSERGENLVFSA